MSPAPDLALPAELTIYTATETRALWLAAIDAPAAATEAEPGAGDPPDAAAFRVDATPLREVDGAGLQLLAALERALRERGRVLHLAGDTPALRDACERLGLGRLLATSTPGAPT